MANSYFTFKAFTIYQDKAAMKVGTDGVLLGAWADVDNKIKALDIGTGTGLIAIMLAQRNPALHITAVDIDQDAIEQAEGNVNLSPWKDRIKLEKIDFVKFASEQSSSYDLIVSNPPFFTASLKNTCEKKSMARHNDNLPFSDLLIGVAKILTDKGSFCVVLPADQQAIFTAQALEIGLFLNKVLYVKPTPNKMPKRVLLKYSFCESDVLSSELIVEDSGRHQYSELYKLLTKDFYLKF